MFVAYLLGDVYFNLMMMINTKNGEIYEFWIYKNELWLQIDIKLKKKNLAILWASLNSMTIFIAPLDWIPWPVFSKGN